MLSASAILKLRISVSSTWRPVFIVFVLLSGTFSQNPPATRQIRGTVEDPSRAAISGATVAASGQNAHWSTTTSADGTFLFSDIGASVPISLTVSASGFSSEQREVPASSHESVLLILLKPQSVSTQLVVTGSRGPLPLEQTPESIQLISGSQIQTSGALEVDDVLRQTAGFDLFRRTSSRTANPTTEGVSLRGVGSSGASRALVLFDGVPISDPFGGWVNWSQLPREAIDSVEMLRGGASDLYGGQALSGVVQLLGKTPETTEADLDLSYGSESTPNASGYVGHAFGRWLASGAGEYFRTNGYIPVPESLRGAVDNAAGSLHRNGELNLERQISQRSRFFVRGLAYDDSRHNGTLVEVNRTRAWNAAVGLDLQGSGNDLLQLRGYGGTEDYHQTFASVAADRNSETLARAQSVPSREWGVSAQYSRPLPARQDLLAGLDLGSVTGESDDEVFTNGRPTSFADGGARNRTLGVFVEDVARISSRLIVTPVLRFDHWQSLEGFSRNIAIPSLSTTTSPFADRSENSVDPKLAMKYQINDVLALRASGYRSFRSPTLNELYRSFRLGNTLTLDNPQLRAERLTGWEAGPTEKLFAGKLRVQETVFWADVHRAIENVTLTTTPALITRMRENLGSTRARGLEAQVEWSVAKFTSISGQYQFVDAIVMGFPGNTSLVGLRVPEVPRHEFTFQASYSNPALLTIAFQGRTSSSVFDDDINTLLLGSYFKLDAFVSRRVNSKLDVYVAGENLLDESYPVARSPIVTLGPPLLGRAGIRFHFGR